MQVTDLKSFSGLETLDLGAFKPKPTTLTEGQVEANVTLWKSADGRERTGVWECTPGRFTADRSTETELCHIISGTASLKRVDGTVTVLRAGDLLMLPRGWRGEWQIIETTRKLYVLISA